MKGAEYALHPLCVLFPQMAEKPFEELTSDIRENGLRQPITLYEGMILDGGHRYKACLVSGVEPRFVEHDGSDLVRFVLSNNLRRRHLSVGQSAALVASATTGPGPKGSEDLMWH